MIQGSLQRVVRHQAFAFVRVAAVPVVASRVKSFAAFNIQKQRLWSNTAVSMLHSALSSMLALAAIAFDHSLHEDFVNQVSPLEFITTAVSTGYFAYDLWDYVLHRLYVKSPGIVVHHVVILICYISALVKTVGVPLLSLALLCELHSAFMHLRRLMAMSGYSSINFSPALGLVWHAQWVAFALARTVPHVVIVWLTYNGHELFAQEVTFSASIWLL